MEIVLLQFLLMIFSIVAVIVASCAIFFYEDSHADSDKSPEAIHGRELLNQAIIKDAYERFRWANEIYTFDHLRQNIPFKGEEFSVGLPSTKCVYVHYKDGTDGFGCDSNPVND